MADLDEYHANAHFSSLFEDQLDEIATKTLYNKIKRRILAIIEFPGTGNRDVRPSLKRRFGEDIRTSAVADYLIVYRFDGKDVVLLALVRGVSVV